MKLLLVANTDWFLFNLRLAQAHYMRQQGFEVVLVSPHGQYVPDLEAEGFRWRSWPVGRKSTGLFGEIRSLMQLKRIYASEKPDFVHHFTIKAVLYGTLSARLCGVKGIVNSITGRGYVFLSRESFARNIRPLIIAMYRALLGNTHIIFENLDDQSYFLNNRLARHEQSHLIPGAGADPRRFAHRPEPEGPPVILYAGRILWDKGIGELVEAGRILRRKGMSFRLCIAGEPDPGNPSSVPVEILEEWKQNGDAEWLGFQKRIEETLQQCHILSLPTYYGEGVPTILIEAAAAGRPIVASDISGCRQVVHDEVNGIIVPPRDPDALAQALERLAQDAPLRRKMGEAGRRIFMDAFTHENINRQTLAVYEAANPGVNNF